MTSKTFYILRHGEIYSGSWWWWRITRLASIDRDDPPLSETGMDKSDVLGTKIANEEFVPEAIIVSPYIRCIQTATQIQKNLSPAPKIIIEPLLAEYQFLVKQTCATYPYGLPEVHNMSNDSTVIFEYPETYDMLAKRCQFVAENIMDKYNNAIFITHGSLVKSFASYFSKSPMDDLISIKFSDYIVVKKNDDKYGVDIVNW